MLIYNQELSVCPLTTHMPLKLVHKKISQKTYQSKQKASGLISKIKMNF